MKRYTLEKKPNFTDGTIVKVDMQCFGGNDNRILEGKIVGKAIDYIIDYWLIQFEEKLWPTYPFKVLSIQHTFIVDET